MTWASITFPVDPHAGMNPHTHTHTHTHTRARECSHTGTHEHVQDGRFESYCVNVVSGSSSSIKEAQMQLRCNVSRYVITTQTFTADSCLDGVFHHVLTCFLADFPSCLLPYWLFALSSMYISVSSLDSFRAVVAIISYMNTRESSNYINPPAARTKRHSVHTPFLCVNTCIDTFVPWQQQRC